MAEFLATTGFFNRKAVAKAVSSANSAESLWPWSKHPRKKAAAAAAQLHK